MTDLASGGATGPGRTGGPPRGVLRQTSLVQLGHQARSVVVPAALVVILSLAGLALTVIAGIGVVAGASLADTDADVAPSTCAARADALRTALDSYRTDEGREASRISDLEPYLDEGFATHTVDFSVDPPEVVVVGGGGCDSALGSAGVRVSDDTDVRIQASVAAVALGFSVAYVLGYLVVVAAIFLQGWWLARAYRCMPISQQRRSPRSAYSPFVVYLTGVFLYAVWFAVSVARGIDPGVFALVVLAGSLVFAVAFVAALLRWIAMLSDVNFAFGRHTAPARLMRISLIWYLALCFVIPAVSVFASAVESGETVLVVLLLVLLGIWVLLPVVGAVSYVVAVVLATYEIERTLRSAAAQLRDLDARGWLEISHRSPRIRR